MLKLFLFRLIHTLSLLFIYLYTRASTCHVVNGDDWVPVSGRVGHFARGAKSFNFIPCFSFRGKSFFILSLFLRSAVVYHLFNVSKIELRTNFLQITKPVYNNNNDNTVYFVDSLSGVFTQAGTRELFAYAST